MVHASGELTEETDIVFIKQPDVVYAVFEKSDALNAHAERKAGVFFAVNVPVFQDVRVHHAGAQDLQPAALFADAAAFTFA
jgi:hypothetical protein